MHSFLTFHFKVKNVQVDREMLLASNKSLADYNLSKKPRLDQAKGTLAAKYEELVRLRKIYDADKQKIGTILSIYIPF